MSGMESAARKRKTEHQDAQIVDAMRRRPRGDDSGRLEHYVEQEKNELRKDAKLTEAVKGATES